MARLEEIFDNSKPGKKIALLGNEAISRGILEAGVSALFTYPGTPSSEIPNTLYAAQQAGILKELEYEFYLEWSINEKVALESAYGFSFSGRRTIFICKHVGLNVAADALLTLINAGVKGGLVIFEAEDPNMYSSQNEQDNRWYSKLANIPIFEPSDASEAKEMLKDAFSLSERFETPVIIRSVTRISHSKIDIQLEKISPPKFPPKISIEIDPIRFVCVPENARVNKTRILNIITNFAQYLKNTAWNIFEKGENFDFAFFTSGSAYTYLKDVCLQFSHKFGTFSIAKIGISHPFPESFVIKLFESHPNTKWIVVEEGDDVLETFIKKIAQEMGYKNPILGRKEGITPKQGEITIDALIKGLKPYIKNEAVLDSKFEDELNLVLPRPPILCPGCPHRGTFYILNRAVRKKSRVISTDIGCYTLGAAPPLEVGHVVIDMGSSLGIGHGLASIPGLEEQIIAIIGDSTFWASGLPGLANATYNKKKILVIIVDNSCTAMTGFQPHPSSNPNPLPNNQLSIEKVVSAMEIPIYFIDPFHPKSSIETLKKATDSNGVSVVISKGECRIQFQHREGLPQIKYQVYADECRVCHSCINLIACPAIMWSEKTKIKGKTERIIPTINQEICTRCGLCVEVCPYGVIRTINGE
ncbi:thiamine pyrophosphate-dependent enzyme [Candidatus Hodarchaeum mangrovi]